MIKSDKWIATQSTPPSHILHTVHGRETQFAWEGITHTKEQLRTMQERYVATPISPEDLQKEGWVPMIEPFERYQVRERNGEKVISYGTSSYGYDVRCANEFKIFTNINSAIIDPKNFDAKSFVDVKSDVCIIPPNSFALARTVEYFRIPRNVLTVCLGKSTFARCFTGDTKVALVDGTTASFVELVERASKGERFWGYSATVTGDIVVAELTAPRKVGHEAVLKVTLDNGEEIRCTPDHKFMLRDGSYVEAKDLKAEDSLIPLYRGVYRGYEAVYQPNHGRMISTHWLSDVWNIDNGVYQHVPNTHRHHEDHNRRNNKPTNLVRLSSSEHAAIHNDERWATQEARDEHGVLVARALAQLAEDSEWVLNYSKVQSERARAFWNDPEYAEAREALLNNRKEVSEQTRQKHREHMLERYASPEERRRHSDRMVKAWEGDVVRRAKQAAVAKMINLRNDITDVTVRMAIEVTGTIRGAARYLGCDRSVFRRFPQVLSEYFGAGVANNHKVVSVEPVEGTHDVYCLTVPEHGNFALESGVFVKNCGIIVNVTPLEPEWEGHVTLEFSNTTNLPAKIYANEGVAQMLFFQSDEDCETSYADRGGKYMYQEGVVVPRV